MFIATAAQTPALPLPTRPIEPSLYPTADFNTQWLDGPLGGRSPSAVQSDPVTWRSSGEVDGCGFSSTLRYEEPGSVSVIDKNLATFTSTHVPEENPCPRVCDADARQICSHGAWEERRCCLPPGVRKTGEPHRAHVRDTSCVRSLPGGRCRLAAHERQRRQRSASLLGSL